MAICNAAADKENPQKMTSALRSVRRGGLSNLCRFEHASVTVFWKFSVYGPEEIMRAHQLYSNPRKPFESVPFRTLQRE
jgi:hypothetical protein